MYFAGNSCHLFVLLCFAELFSIELFIYSLSFFMKLFLLISASFLSPAALFYFIYLFLSLSLFNFIHCLPLPRQFSKACIFIFVRKVMRVVIAKVTISASCLAAAKKKKQNKKKICKKKIATKAARKVCHKTDAINTQPKSLDQVMNGKVKMAVPKPKQNAQKLAKRKTRKFQKRAMA